LAPSNEAVKAKPYAVKEQARHYPEDNRIVPVDTPAHSLSISNPTVIASAVSRGIEFMKNNRSRTIADFETCSLYSPRVFGIFTEARLSRPEPRVKSSDRLVYLTFKGHIGSG
jgi:hypothetical protein